MPSPRSLSFWLDDVPDSLESRPALAADLQTDVAIVGAGFTGLWTAYYLRALDPTCRVAVIDAEFAGYGASGRNGGMCDGRVAGIGKLLRRDHDGALALWRAMFDAVDEVGRVVRQRGIDCGYRKGGSLHVALLPSQREKLARILRGLHGLGFGDEDFRWLEPDEVATRANLAGRPAAIYTPHAAALQPARLARGLAQVAEALGARIYEKTPAISIEPGAVRTRQGSISANAVVRATEAYGVGLRGERRSMLPMYNYVIATEPLSQSAWDEIGMKDGVTVADAYRQMIYLQRTADGRIAFGGRGSPYRFGSAIRPEHERDARVFARLQAELARVFPAADGMITHRWGGVFGVPRDMAPSVGFDRPTGLAWAGGYVGSGVACANLAGRTLADLILGRDSDRVHFAWARRPSRPWLPEPLRWVGVQAVLRMLQLADWTDRRAPIASRGLDRIIGHIAPGWEGE